VTWALVLAIVAAGFLVADLLGWLAWLALRIVSLAARALPASEQGRYREEWLAEYETLPGGGGASMLFAVGVVSRVRALRRVLTTADERPDEDLALHSVWWAAFRAARVAQLSMDTRPAGDTYVRFPGGMRLWCLRGLQWALEGTGRGAVRAVLDFAMVCLAALIAFGGIEGSSHINFDLVLALAVLLVSAARGVYSSNAGLSARTEVVTEVVLVSIAVIVTAGLEAALSHTTPATPDGWLGAWCLALMGIGAGCALLAWARRRARARRLIGKPVLVLVGTDFSGERVVERLRSIPELGLVPVGLVEDSMCGYARHEVHPRGLIDGREPPTLGTSEELGQIVALTGVRDLIVNLQRPPFPHVALRPIVRRSKEHNLNLHVVSLNPEPIHAEIFGLRVLALSPVDPSARRLSFKHALDRALAALILIASSPLLIAAAIAVKLSGPGPVFSKRPRAGRDRHVFWVYRFRTTHKPRTSKDSAALPGNVRRGTPARGLPRSSLLDVLLQFFSVLSGDMSIVGPAVESEQFARMLTEDPSPAPVSGHWKPGITGLAQVHGVDDHAPAMARVVWDNHYIAHWSLKLDLKILVLAAANTIRRSTRQTAA